MAELKLQGHLVNTNSDLPSLGQVANNFELVSETLETVNLESFGSKRKVLNIFPSIDTPTCATSVRTFNKEASSLENTVVINISKDLPFAQQRFCGSEGLKDVVNLSDFRGDFSREYGVELVDSPLKGLAARAVFVLNEKNEIVHVELVEDIVQEPNYETAIASLK